MINYKETPVQQGAVSLYLNPKRVKQMEQYLRKNEMKRPAIDRAFIRAFMGNLEDFNLSW